MSNFSFSHCVFYPFGELSAIFIKFEIVVCKLIEFGRVYNLSFGKGLRFYYLRQLGLVGPFACDSYLLLLVHLQIVKREFYNVKKIEVKESFADLVTETDRAVEKMLMTDLGQTYPSHKYKGPF